MMNSSAKFSGFTFVELVVVVTIFSIVLLFTVPLFKNVSVFSSNQPNVFNLIQQIQELKQKSVRVEKDYFLHINPHSGLVWTSDETMDEEALDHAMQKGIVYEGDVTILNIEFFDDSRSETYPSVIRFYRQGYSDRALIHLRENNEDITLKIPAFLTRVEHYRRYISYDDCI